MYFRSLESRKIGSLKKSDVRRFYNGLVDSQRLKVATVENIHTVLHQVKRPYRSFQRYSSKNLEKAFPVPICRICICCT